MPHPTDPDHPAEPADEPEPEDEDEPGGHARPMDPLAHALYAGYRDPTRIQPVPAGPAFDLVSVPMEIGLDALDLMRRAGGPVGPVAVDARAAVSRVGFLLPPGTLRAEPGFAWWCRRHGVRTASHGDVVALPPLVGESTRMVWLVAPDAPDTGRTETWQLLSALRRASAVQRRRLRLDEA